MKRFLDNLDALDILKILDIFGARLLSSALLPSILFILLLSTCSRQRNPLQTVHFKVAAKFLVFLVYASQYAERKLHIFNAPGGYYYGACMAEKVNKTNKINKIKKINKKLCDKLYVEMQTYAKSMDGPNNFKKITIDQLIDQSNFNVLRMDYRREQFEPVE